MHVFDSQTPLMQTVDFWYDLTITSEVPTSDPFRGLEDEGDLVGVKVSTWSSIISGEPSMGAEENFLIIFYQFEARVENFFVKKLF